MVGMHDGGKNLKIMSHLILMSLRLVGSLS
jgi:hypothetical protein